jgi:(R,R)-butanediol dehydrogenase/meso-butanediol dehydrogenase/diacetyl reductase
VVIAVKRCGICGTDLHATEEHDGLLVPGTVTGHEFAGEIVEVG